LGRGGTEAGCRETAVVQRREVRERTMICRVGRRSDKSET
jgi:hypothetical protein